ncbi:hypothetical protein H0H92_014863, partial [Tricholoma furcatifolium]
PPKAEPKPGLSSRAEPGKALFLQARRTGESGGLEGSDLLRKSLSFECVSKRLYTWIGAFWMASSNGRCEDPAKATDDDLLIARRPFRRDARWHEGGGRRGKPVQQKCRPMAEVAGSARLVLDTTGAGSGR